MNRKEYEHKSQTVILNLLQLLNFWGLTNKKSARMKRSFGIVSSGQIYQAARLAERMYNFTRNRPKVNTEGFLKRQAASSNLIYILRCLKVDSAEFGHYHDKMIHRYVHRHFEFSEWWQP